jgi:hypothetical protein
MVTATKKQSMPSRTSLLELLLKLDEPGLLNGELIHLLEHVCRWSMLP